MLVVYISIWLISRLIYVVLIANQRSVPIPVPKKNYTPVSSPRWPE